MEWIKWLSGAPRHAVEKAPVVQEPLLLLQLWMIDSDESILSTLDTECDVNVKDSQYGTTPLHLAVYRKTLTVAQKLIEKGADLNARDFENVTPLHCALKWSDSNYDTVYLLLYYGADVQEKCCNHLHPFGHALLAAQFQCASILRNYYDFDDICEDVNLFFERNFSEFSYSIPNYSFKELWPLLDHRVLRKVPYFLSTYLKKCQYNNKDWIECLYNILDSLYAHEIITEWGPDRYNQVDSLLIACRKRYVDSGDRINVIYKFLTTGMQVHVFDIYCIYVQCGFGEELDAFLHCASISIWCSDIYKFPIESFLLLQDENSMEGVLQLFANRISRHCLYDTKNEQIINAISWFSFSSTVREKLLDMCKKLPTPVYDKVMIKLSSVPEIPSLMELCRKVIRRSLRQKQFVYLYEFYDNVKKLGVPQKIIDVITFKCSLYP